MRSPKSKPSLWASFEIGQSEAPAEGLYGQRLLRVNRQSEMVEHDFPSKSLAVACRPLGKEGLMPAATAV